MSEEQVKQMQSLVQEIADFQRVSFDEAFRHALNALRFYSIDRIPKGEGRAGGSGQSA